MNKAVQNISKKFKFADIEFNADRNHNKFECEALIGIDLLQHFESLNLKPCLNGRAFEINKKLIPCGSVRNFLSDSQCKSVFQHVSENKSLLTVGNFSTMIEDALCPVKNYFTP